MQARDAPVATRVVGYDEWDSGNVMRKWRGYLNPTQRTVQFNRAVLAAVSSERLGAREFEVTYQVETPDSHLMYFENDEENEVLIRVNDKPQLHTEKFRARFARVYRWERGEFSVLVPENGNIIYGIQKIPDASDTTQIQWSDYSHDGEKERTLESADSALLDLRMSPAPMLIALLSNFHAFLIEAGCVSDGNYREIA